MICFSARQEMLFRVGCKVRTVQPEKILLFDLSIGKRAPHRSSFLHNKQFWQRILLDP